MSLELRAPDQSPTMAQTPASSFAPASMDSWDSQLRDSANLEVSICGCSNGMWRMARAGQSGHIEVSWGNFDPSMARCETHSAGSESLLAVQWLDVVRPATGIHW